MNVLIVYAHPQPRSLNGALRDFAVRRLEAAGHRVQVSDLYAMQWKATLDEHDAPERDPREPFDDREIADVALKRAEQVNDPTAMTRIELKEVTRATRREVEHLVRVPAARRRHGRRHRRDPMTPSGTCGSSISSPLATSRA